LKTYSREKWNFKYPPLHHLCFRSQCLTEQLRPYFPSAKANLLLDYSNLLSFIAITAKPCLLSAELDNLPLYLFMILGIKLSLDTR